MQERGPSCVERHANERRDSRLSSPVYLAPSARFACSTRTIPGGDGPQQVREGRDGGGETHLREAGPERSAEPSARARAGDASRSRPRAALAVRERCRPGGMKVRWLDVEMSCPHDPAARVPRPATVLREHPAWLRATRECARVRVCDPSCVERHGHERRSIASLHQSTLRRPLDALVRRQAESQ